ncbi:hypothetical protein T261_7728 [Streptomyces lydicus]|nr:hypothetical protein T261_7728 [Streptomyces lydicus]
MGNRPSTAGGYPRVECGAPRVASAACLPASSSPMTLPFLRGCPARGSAWSLCSRGTMQPITLPGCRASSTFAPPWASRNVVGRRWPA